MRRRRLPHSTTSLCFALALSGGTLLTSGSFAADGDEEKRVCVAAADQGQLVRDSGQYAEAWTQFTACAAPECPMIVRQQCGVWLQQLEDAMPTVVFALVDPAGRDLTDVSVVADGKVVATALDGRPISLDPGPHEIRFQPRGRSPIATSVILRAGEKNRAVRAEAPLEPVPDAPAITVRTGFWDARSTTTVTLLAVGLVSAGAGIYFGVSSQTEADRAAGLRQNLGPSGCVVPGSRACQSLSADVDAQSRDATLSTAFYISGGVLAAAGALAWLTWPRHSSLKRTDPRTPVSLNPILGLGFAGMNAEIKLQ